MGGSKRFPSQEWWLGKCREDEDGTIQCRAQPRHRGERLRCGVRQPSGVFGTSLGVTLRTGLRRRCVRTTPEGRSTPCACEGADIAGWKSLSGGRVCPPVTEGYCESETTGGELPEVNHQSETERQKKPSELDTAEDGRRASGVPAKPASRPCQRHCWVAERRRLNGVHHD